MAGGVGRVRGGVSRGAGRGVLREGLSRIFDENLLFLKSSPLFLSFRRKRTWSSPEGYLVIPPRCPALALNHTLSSPPPPPEEGLLPACAAEGPDALPVLAKNILFPRAVLSLNPSMLCSPAPGYQAVLTLLSVFADTMMTRHISVHRTDCPLFFFGRGGGGRLFRCLCGQSLLSSKTAPSQTL